MAKPPLLSVDDLRQLLNCDPETGELRWRERSAEWFPSLGAAKTWNKKHPGNLALQNKSVGGYLFGQIQKRTYMAHRVVWAICKGQNVQAGSFIDHIDGNPGNNAISNLRECTPAQNQHNSQKKTAGLRGACFHKRNQRWTASIRVHLGYFDSEEEAAACYEAAAKKLHSKFYLPKGVRKLIR